MEIAAHRYVVGGFEKLGQALAEGPENWMPGTLDSATGEIGELEADTPVGRLARYARIELGPPEVEPRQVIVPISWHSLEAAPLFPVFTGRLRLNLLADGTNRLELEGAYEPPAGVIGRAADVALLHALARATVEDLVQRIAGILTRNALSRAAAAQEAAGALVREDETWR
jgi:hypothetical protein